MIEDLDFSLYALGQTLEAWDVARTRLESRRRKYHRRTGIQAAITAAELAHEWTALDKCIREFALALNFANDSVISLRKAAPTIASQHTADDLHDYSENSDPSPQPTVPHEADR